MTSPSKRTVTDKLCDQARRKVWSKLEKDYERAFVHRPASDEFFKKMEELFEKLDHKLVPRPLSKAEILSLTTRAGKAFVALIGVEAKKNPQPKMREATNIVTGETRMIPDYGE